MTSYLQKLCYIFHQVDFILSIIVIVVGADVSNLT